MRVQNNSSNLNQLCGMEQVSNVIQRKRRYTAVESSVEYVKTAKDGSAYAKISVPKQAQWKRKQSTVKMRQQMSLRKLTVQ